MNIGTLDFEVLVKDDKIKGMLEETKRRIQDFSHAMKQGGSDMDGAFDRASKTVERGFETIGNAIEMNKASIAKLQNEYEELGRKAGDALQKGQDKKYAALTSEQSEKKILISVNKNVLNELHQADEALVKYSKHLDEQREKTEKTTQKQVTAVRELRNMREELIRMEAAGLRGTEAYRKLQERAGALTDAIGDVTQQAAVLAHDQAAFQGVISGLGGITGAASAAQGAMALFAGEDENLQKLMVKIQSLMSITIGLQQISQALDKDSAFQIVTIQGIKGWWDKVKEAAFGYKSAIEEIAEPTQSISETVDKVSESVSNAAEAISDVSGTVADAAGAASEAANTVATKSNTAAKGENAAAEAADAAATKVNTQATNQNTVSQDSNAAATAGQAVAAKVGTVANLTLAGAFRAVGVAIRSIPVIGWVIAGVAALVAVVSYFASKAAEARKAAEEFYKAVAEEAKKPVAQIQKLAYEWSRLGDDMKAKEKFIKDNKRAFEELGFAIKGVADAEAILSDKTRVQAFVSAQIAKAKAAVLYKDSEEKIRKLTEAEQHLEEEEKKPTISVYKPVGATGYYEQVENPQIAYWRDEAEKIKKEIKAGYEKILVQENEAAKKMKEAGAETAESYEEGTLGALEHAISEKRKKLSEMATSDLAAIQAEMKEIEKLEKQRDDLLGKGDEQAKKEAERKAEEQKRLQKQLNNELLDMMRKNQSDRIALMEDGEKKELAQIADQYDREIAEIEEKVAKWKEAQDGKLTDEQTVEYDAAYQNAFDKRLKAEADFYKKRDKESRQTWNEYLKEFGSHQEKILAIQELYAAKIAEAKTDGEKNTLAAERDREISTLNADMMKETALWKKFFGDVEKMGKKSIGEVIRSLDMLLAYANGDLKELPSDLAEAFNSLNDGTKETEEIIKEIKDRLNEVREASRRLNAENPFKRIMQGFDELGKSADSSQEQMSALHNILSGFDEVAGIFDSLTRALTDAGLAADDTLVKISQVISRAGEGAATGASIGKGWGALVGAVVGAGLGLVEALGGSKGLSEETASYYETLIQVTDELIEKQLELVDAATGAAAMIAAENAKLLNEYKKEHLTEALDTYLKNSGWNYHSEGYEFQQKLLEYITSNAELSDKQAFEAAHDAMFKADGRNFKIWKIVSDQLASGNLKVVSKFLNVEELEKKGIKLEEVLRDVSGTLTSYTGEQLETLKTFAPEVWALLDDGTRNYLEGIIAADKYIKEIENRTMESLTGATSESISGSLDELYSEADLTFEKIGDSFEEHIKRAILNAVSKNSLGKIQDWYEQFAKDMDDGILSPEEAEMLRQKYKEIAESGNESYKKALEVLNMPLEGITSSMPSLAGAIKGASQEEINTLAGSVNHTVMIEREQTELIRDQLMLLSNIDGKIGISNQFLESIDGRLTAKSDPLRAVGIQ